ncbi:MAG: NUDIX domain-containing protein [Actinomycetales bacterium]|nr:NUDIX domain-containing protein [Actinomycetales bacterium]
MRGQVPPPGFESLFETTYVPYAESDVVGTLDLPPLPLLHRVHLVASPAPGLVTVCASAEGWRFLPGGRLEPGESLQRAAERELEEEAGSRPLGPAEVFYSQIATSRAPDPYRAHAPHPVAWWSFAVVRTEVTGAPTCPADGEQIVGVHHLEADAAAAWLQVHDPVHAAVVRLAQHLGHV